MIIAFVVGGYGFLDQIVQESQALGQLAPPNIPSLIGYAVALVVIAIVGHILIAAISPEDANAASDERDRHILVRAGHHSGMVLGFGVITALGHFLYTQNGDWLFYGVYASLVVSQLTEYALQLYYYRASV